MAFTIQEFAANISQKNGLAKSSLFEVDIKIPSIVSTTIKKLVDGWTSYNQDLQTNRQKSQYPGDAAASGNKNATLTDRQLSTKLASKETEYTNSPFLLSNPDSLHLQCEGTELPGRTTTLSEAKVYGLNYKMPYQVAFNDISFTFLCTNYFYERKLFEFWMDCIIPTDTYNIRFMQDESGSTYTTTIDLFQYDHSGQIIYSVRLYDAFPISINPQPVNWADESFHKLTVQFTYKHYKIIV